MNDQLDENHKPSALVIEDDPQLVTIFATAMEIAGYAVQTAADGRIALEKLQTLAPDVILLDIHLPYVSGDELLRHIRADERLQESVVILSTADSRIAAQLREETNLILLKPIRFNELVELAQSLI
ncbi:MAG: response regulator transcription factor [Chloroflexi bacterium]|nr:response regulator transcription factor [Chloroflexota bacterium]